MRQCYRQAKQNHRSERDAFLQSLATKDSECLIRTKHQWELGRAAKHVTGKLTDQSVTKVLHNGVECTDQSSIERALLQVNKNKIRASKDNPFLQEPLLSEFGTRNITPATQAIMEGTFQCPPGISQCTQALLASLHCPTVPNKVVPFSPQQSITWMDNTRAWKCAKEKTLVGASGLHFGMFKAHASRPSISALDASVQSFAYITGFSYARWKKGIDVQLLKRKKDFRAEKLRTILLLEADFNMNNKALSSNTMKIGEQHRDFSVENYGGRKGH